MNKNRIITWGIFVVIVGLIVWGMIASAQKSARQGGYIAVMNQASSTDWVIGNASSTVTLVEYSDFQCPACALYFPLVDKIVKENSNKIKFIYRNFPLPPIQHKNAMPAAQAAGAAGKQGKFWEMYSMLFSTHDEWENSTSSKEVFRGYAEKLGLNMEQYVSDFDSASVIDKINYDLQEGQNAGIDSTPTFYLNGKQIVPRSYEEFKKLIDDATQAKN